MNEHVASISLQAYQRFSFLQFYVGGVAHPWEIFCNPKELNHGVLIVGYGVSKCDI